jgi:hypothetical protein
MEKWKTTLHLSINNSNIITQPISIKRGIYQGNSLSLLWFCLAINPLSSLLNKTGYGYIKQKRQTIYKITHLLYVDDIKLYASTQRQLKQLLEITEQFSTDIQMSFGTDKCRIQTITARVGETVGFELRQGGAIE